jgi:hypothetical protein
MMTFTRQQLYDLVWEKPTVQVAKQIGVSDVAIAKACKRHQIPKPPLGYWAMLQHGKQVDRAALPEVDDPGLARVSFEPLSPDDRRARADKAETDATAEQLNVPVPAVLQSPHPLIERTIGRLQAAKPDVAGICHVRAKDCLDVYVAKNNIDRAMRIMDALLKALIARGAKVWVNVPEYGPSTTYAEADGEKVELRLNETTKKRPAQLTEAQKRENAKHTYFKPHKDVEPYATGIFVLSLKSRHTWDRRRWVDQVRKKVEDRVGEAVAALFDAIAECKEADRRKVEREKQWAEERRLQAEAEERRRRHEAHVKRLREEAAFWEEAQRIRAYVSAADEKIAAAGPIEQDSKFARWIKWARRQADRMDPLTPTAEEPENDGLDAT